MRRMLAQHPFSAIERKKFMCGENQIKGKASALLPIGIFLVIFLGSGIVFNDFYAMPAVVAFLIALFVAFLQNRKVGFQEKIRLIAGGVGEENIITMCLIFLCAGGFSGAVTAAGGVTSTVNLGLSLIPAHFVVAGLFVIGSLFPCPWERPWELSLPLHRLRQKSAGRQGFPWQSVLPRWYAAPCSGIIFP